jgi:hypothetical protein
MGIQAPAEVKFRLIQNATRRDDNLLSIKLLCEIAGVSRSGYYNWIGNEGKRQTQEEADKDDFYKIYAPLPDKRGIGLAIYNRMIRAAAHTIIKLGC